MIPMSTKTDLFAGWYWVVLGPYGIWVSSVAFTRTRAIHSFLNCCRQPRGGTWQAARKDGFTCIKIVITPSAE